MRFPQSRPGIWAVLPLLALALFANPAGAQNRVGRTYFGRSFGFGAEFNREQDEMKQALRAGFEADVFTFARLHFENTEGGYDYGGYRGWLDDSPEADCNLSFRLHEVTSLKIRPAPSEPTEVRGVNFIDITTKDLEKYPFVYLAAAGRVEFDATEAAALRRYLLNGGFMMVDDFWGDEQWSHFHEQLKQVFPDREPQEISLDHPIFHTVYNFKKEPQIPSVGAFQSYGDSWEPGWPYYVKSHEPHYYAIYDAHNRMMALICHNNHYGDGWEHESHDENYFDKFSEPMAYPMFINIIEYTMTH